ncbi:MAG: hypothetical protein HKN04_12515 [Rhodothermaceae bacterium]|nr:hypothetical protein [Rhodothermaceae bacterium]
MKIPHHRQAAAAAYTRAQTPSVPTAPTAPAEAKPSAEAKSTASASEPAQPSDLSVDEQQMIDRYFPPKPEMTLRLYGPGREAQTVSPNALGGRLDLNA